MNELQKPSPELAALSREWQHQFESGELAAGYWQWYVIDGACKNSVASPNWPKGYDYEYEPRLNHPHYAVYKEWEAHKASGAVERGEYVLKERYKSQFFECHNVAQSVSWYVENTYTIEKTSLHPDNQKPKLKLVDWENVPVGTMTDLGEIRAHKRKHGGAFVEDSLRCNWGHHDYSYLSIVPTTKWTAVQDGGKPPVCEGLVIEYRMTSSIFQSSNKLSCHTVGKNTEAVGINAYRVIGLAEGYTDDPEKATV